MAEDQNKPNEKKPEDPSGSAFNTDTPSNSGEQKRDPLFNDMVGEGKRYATVEELAKGKQEADAFIEQLKSETAGLREDLSKRPTMEDIQDIVKSYASEQESTNSNVSGEDIQKLVQTELQASKVADKQADNVKQASDKMFELYGDKAKEVVQQKANELGVAVEYLEQMAAANPKIFYATMGVQDNPNNQGSDGGNHQPEGHNAEQFQKKTEQQTGTWSYYRQLRKENPKNYWSPKVQNEIFRLRKEQGPEFYNS